MLVCIGGSQGWNCNTLFRAKYELCCLSIEFMCNHSQNSLNRLNGVF